MIPTNSTFRNKENKQERSKNSIQKNFKEQRYNLKRLLEEGLSEIKFNTSQKHLKHKEKLLTLRDSIKGPINVYCVNKSRSEALYLYQTCNIAGKKLKSIDLTEAVLSHMWKELMDKIHLLEKKCQKKDGFKIINSENILRCVSTFITKDYQQYNKDILDIFAPKTRHLDSCYDIVSNKFKTYKELNPLTESIVKTQFNNVKASI